MIFPQSDIRNQIISILSENFPLSFRKISNRLRKKFNRSISDKALYRFIGLMVNDGILIRKNSEYMINPEWMGHLDKFVKNIAKKYIQEDCQDKSLYSIVKQECSCGKGYAEGFCSICNESICPKCGEKTRLHYSCLDSCDKCEDEEFVEKCASCLKDACVNCSKEVWAHFSEHCTKNPDRAIFGILEVAHECWFADLSEKLDDPIRLESFVDQKDKILNTHSGRIQIQAVNRKVAINSILNHKQIVDVKPIYSDRRLILRTRALFNKSVDEFVRSNKSILLNPIKAFNTKERNLVIAPNIKEIKNMINGLNEVGKCKLVACEEVELNKLNSINSREISYFIKLVKKDELENAMQRIRVIKNISGEH